MRLPSCDYILILRRELVMLYIFIYFNKLESKTIIKGIWGEKLQKYNILNNKNIRHKSDFQLCWTRTCTKFDKDKNNVQNIIRDIIIFLLLMVEDFDCLIKKKIVSQSAKRPIFFKTQCKMGKTETKCQTQIISSKCV